MRIIHQGVVPVEGKWWVERPFKCPRCGTVWVLEESDTVTPTGDAVSRPCPLDRVVVTIRKQ